MNNVAVAPFGERSHLFDQLGGVRVFQAFEHGNASKFCSVRVERNDEFFENGIRLMDVRIDARVVC